MIYRQTDVASLHSEISRTTVRPTSSAKCSRPPCRRWRRRCPSSTWRPSTRAADLLHGAGQRDFYGVGGSAQIARDVAHKFLRIGLRASVQDDPHMM